MYILTCAHVQQERKSTREKVSIAGPSLLLSLEHPQNWKRRIRTKLPVSQHQASWVLLLYLLTESGAHYAQHVFLFPLDSSQCLFSSIGAPQDSSKTRFNYISKKKKKKTREECKHDSFLSPDTSGQADNVLKQNKSALTVTSKSSARGLQLLKAQECCCQAPAHNLSIPARNAFFFLSGGDEESWRVGTRLQKEIGDFQRL